MAKVKIFQTNRLTTLEERINTWMEEMSADEKKHLCIIDIRYQMGFVDEGKLPYYSAMLFYSLENIYGGWLE